MKNCKESNRYSCVIGYIGFRVPSNDASTYDDDDDDDIISRNFFDSKKISFKQTKRKV